MMQKKSITPRLNYHFSLLDFFIAIKGVFFKSDGSNSFNNYFPDSNIYYTNHARTGLRIMLSSLDLPKNSNVGVLVYNCLTVFKSIKLAGYNPIFIDSTPNHKIDINDLKQKEQKIDALIVTHLFGILANIQEIKKIMGKKPIIEDCAHAFLNKVDDKYVGSFGVGSIFSFGHAKFPAAAEGGIVVINNEKLNAKFKNSYANLKEDKIINKLIDITKAYISAILMNKYIYSVFTLKFKQHVGENVDINNKYVFNEKKCNSGFYTVFSKRMQNIASLKHKQNNNAASIRISLNSSEKINSEDISANFMIPIKTSSPKTLIQSALRNGIEFGQHFKKSILWANEYGYVDNDCKNAEKLIDDTVTIPCYYRLTKKDVKKIEYVLNLSENKKNLYK